MSFLSNLLNPAPASGPSSPEKGGELQGSIDTLQESHAALSKQDDASVATSTSSDHATSSNRLPASPEVLKSPNAYRSPNTTTARYSNSPPTINMGSYGRAAQPVEPSPPLERGSFSPTLEQYHLPRAHEIQRRQSMAVARDTPPPVLAPIQSHSSHGEEDPAQSDVTREALGSVPSERIERRDTDEHEDIDIHQTSQPALTSEIQRSRTEAAPVLMELEPPTIPPEPEVKAEPTNINSPAKIPPSIETSQGTPSALPDMPTPRKITDLKHEASSRASSAERSSPVRGTPGPMPAPTTGATKKRPAPSTTGKKAAEAKKGTARKPAPKKRKLDTDSVGGTPVSSRREGSGTPTSSRASKTPAPRGKQQSSASLAGSPAPNAQGDDGQMSVAGDDEDDEDDGEVFCICRKPDNHTWMIGCDGGCEDWFHGKCVDMREEDGDLIDKYICPNCEENEKGHTTWKPMCRLQGCRKPARLSVKSPSKFCCDEHGKEFMRRAIPGAASGSSSKEKSRRKKNRADHTGNGEDDDQHSKKRRRSGEDDDYIDTPMGDDEDEDEEEDDDYNGGARGGKLDSREIKAVISGVSSVEEFRKLGEAFIMSPPATVSPEDDMAMNTKLPSNDTALSFSPAEDEQVQKMEEKRTQLATKREALKDKEKLFTLIRQRGKAVLEKLQKSEPKLKDICGFDSRLSWSEVEFEEWRTSNLGKAALMSGILMAPPAKDGDDGSDMEMRDAEDEEDESIRGVCQKKRCERHKQWIKLQQQEIRFEEDRVRKEWGDIEAEIKGVRQRALLRTLQS